MKRFENKNPYFININNSWVGVEEKPEWENQFSNLIKEYKFPLIIITGLIIIVVGFFLYRRKKAKLITLLILFSSSGSLVAQSNQLTNYAKKDFNIEILKNEKLTATSMPELDSQFHFIKSYKKVMILEMLIYMYYNINKNRLR
jgi:hypothetical protein